MKAILSWLKPLLPGDTVVVVAMQAQHIFAMGQLMHGLAAETWHAKDVL